MIREFRGIRQDGSPHQYFEIYENCFPGNGPKLFQTILNFDTIILIDSYLDNNRGMIVGVIDREEPWIWTVAVKKGFRERGIGASLMNEIEKKYEGYKRISLYVSPDNPAQKLYFDLGYRVVEIADNIYENGHALKMVKELN